MQLKEIQELIKTLDESKLTSLELEKDGFKLSLKKDSASCGQSAEQIISGGQVILADQVIPAGQVISAGEAPAPPGLTVDSPIVGTFYAAPAPGEAPFVQPGSRVKKGDVLCIVEAMKLMNEIEAEEDLEILDVLVADGQMVEYGQPLFAVKRIGQ